jgi:hypothetical protein
VTELIHLTGLDPERLARLETLLVDSGRLEAAEGALQRLAARHVALETKARELERRMEVLETWAQEPSADFSKAGTRLSALESKLVIDRQAIVAGLVAEIRRDPQLRELLRGPRGQAGEDGKPGPPGDAGSTVIREVKIAG